LSRLQHLAEVSVDTWKDGSQRICSFEAFS
jgi:hypothetical protein